MVAGRVPSTFEKKPPKNNGPKASARNPQPVMNAQPDSAQSSKVPLYAQGPYHRELNYKLWSTYKSRFNASARHRKKHELSNKAVALLSAYVVIFSLITTMLPQFSEGGTGNVILFISSALSIVILVVSQLESSQNYSVRALTYHQSGLQISELYKELRALKTRYPDRSGDEFNKAVESISERYDDVLRRSENHEDIDFDLFRASKPSYEDHSLSKRDVVYLKAKLLMTEYAFYYVAMVLPIALFSLFIVVTRVEDSSDDQSAVHPPVSDQTSATIPSHQTAPIQE
jgi:hypothetical protein